MLSFGTVAALIVGLGVFVLWIRGSWLVSLLLFLPLAFISLTQTIDPHVIRITLPTAFGIAFGPILLQLLWLAVLDAWRQHVRRRQAAMIGHQPFK